MFHLVCIIYILIIIYSIITQLKVIINYKKNKKIKIKDGSGLFVSKEILTKNNLATLYVTKVNNKYSDHYDIERNVIRLSKEVYNDEDLSSLTTSFYQVIKALAFQDNKTRKENKLKFLSLDITNKIAFIFFMIAASSKDLGIMLLCLVLMIFVIITRYLYIDKYSKLIEENINYLKKEYKLKEIDIKQLEKTLNILLLNEISIHLINAKY
ncbi:MAG: hypothetical protein E7162_06880 [Firmicutes bacterium]|nr:hypothetical protein [Bacillota bacterium]